MLAGTHPHPIHCNIQPAETHPNPTNCNIQPARTHPNPINCNITNTCRDTSQPHKTAATAGNKYQADAKSLKERMKEMEKEKRGDEVDLGGLGPPHLVIWAELVKCIARSTEQSLGKDKRAPFVAYWNEVICKSDAQQVGMHIRLCRARQAKQQKAGSETVKVQIAIDERHAHETVGAVAGGIDAVMLAWGGVRKFGPAPKGSLERDAQRLLDELKG